MDTWEKGSNYAMVVCPIYQLPNTASQIYHQASSKQVSIFYLLPYFFIIKIHEFRKESNLEELLMKIFEVINILNPSKDAYSYWKAINTTMIEYSDEIKELWKTEKVVASEAIKIAKDEDIEYLEGERERIMRMNLDEALKELIKVNKIESKLKIINAIRDNGIFSIN